MTHDDILKAARERIAEIDKQTAALAEERAKLQAMLGAQPVMPQFVPLPSLRPMPEVTCTPHTGLPTGTFTTCTTGTTSIPTIDALGQFGITADFPLLAFNEDFTPPDIVIGGPQRLPSDMRFKA